MSGDDEEFDEDFFNTVDKAVEQHNASKAQTQHLSQALSPIQQPANGANGGIAPHAAPPIFPNAQLQNAGSAPGLPMGRISNAATQLRATAAGDGTGTQVIPQQNGAVFTGGGGAGGAVAPPVVDVASLQHRAEVAEGSNRILRSNLEQLERERHGLRQRLAQLEGRGAGSHQAATVDEMKRRQPARTETAPIAAVDNNRDGAGAQQAVGEANVSRPGTAKSHASRQAAAVPGHQQEERQQQQQQQQQADRTKRRADGSPAPVAQAQPQPQPTATFVEPLFPLALSVLHLGEGQSSAVARLWAACPKEMGIILDAARSGDSSVPPPSHHASLSFAPLAGHGQNIDRSRLPLDPGIASHAAMFADTVPRVVSGVQDAAMLLHALCSLVFRASVLISEESHQGGQGGSSPFFRENVEPLAAAAMGIMGHLVQDNARCQKAALASFGCVSACEGPPRAPSNRVVFTEQSVLTNDAYPDTSMAEEERTSGSNLATFSFALRSPSSAATNSTNNNSVSGVLAIVIQATLAFGAHSSTHVVASALELAFALASAARSGGGRSALLPLATSGALSAFFNAGPSLRLQALHLLYLLLEDPSINSAASEDIVSAAAARSPAVNGTNAVQQRRRSSSTTPVTRGASSRRAAVVADVDAEGDVEMQGEEPVRWAASVLDLVLQSLVLETKTEPPAAAAVAAIQRADEGEVARAVLALLALLLEQQSDACLRYLIERETVLSSQTTRPSSAAGGGVGTNGPATGDGSNAGGNLPTSASLPVKLVLLAEDAVKYNGENSELVPLSAAGWPKGQWPSVAAPQATWQLRLRIAQEALTLLRGLMLSPTLGIVATDELLSSSAVQQKILSGLGRLSRVEAPPPEGGELLSGVPVAAWAYAVGTSTAAASMGSPEGAAARGGMPCCSAKDVVYLARGTKHRMMHRLSA